MIEIRTVNGKQYLLLSQLGELERYSHLYYDLSINIEGIDAIRHILGRMDSLQQEIRQLRRQLKRYQTSNDFFPEDRQNHLYHLDNEQVNIRKYFNICQGIF